MRAHHPDVIVYQEVIDLGNEEAVSAEEYFHLGRVTEFVYSAEIGRVFRHGKLSWLRNFNESWEKDGAGESMMPSKQAIVFVDNHDNQRGHGAGSKDILTHKDGIFHELANVFMLAWPYGRPRVMSSFEFINSDQGPPQTPVHALRGEFMDACFREWKCEHRRRAISAMVGFRNITEGELVTHWRDNENDLIAFGRGDKGFVVINGEPTLETRVFQTALPPGRYYDVISGPTRDWSSTELEITVQPDGKAEISVPPWSARAFHVGARL